MPIKHLKASFQCSHAATAESFVLTSLVQLLCRTSKICWFDDDQFRNIVDDAKTFLDKGTSEGSTVSFCLPTPQNPQEGRMNALQGLEEDTNLMSM